MVSFFLKNYYIKIKNIMNSKLNELFVLCSKHDFEFVLKKEGNVNNITYNIEPKKKITVDLPDVDDVNLNKLIDSKIVELKDLFK